MRASVASRRGLSASDQASSHASTETLAPAHTSFDTAFEKSAS